MQGQLDFTTESRAFPPDDLPLLTAQLRLPRWNGTGGGRFNRYYSAYGRAFFSYCQGVLLPQAQTAFDLARENGGLLPEWQIILDSTVTLEQNGLLSLYTDTTERCGGRRLKLRRSENWALSDGTLLPLSRFYPAGTKWRRSLLEIAAEQIRQQQEQGNALFYPDWKLRLRKAFHPDRFYLTEQHLCLYYQMFSIAPAAEGIPVFTVPFDAENGPILPA